MGIEGSVRCSCGGVARATLSRALVELCIEGSPTVSRSRSLGLPHFVTAKVSHKSGDRRAEMVWWLVLGNSLYFGKQGQYFYPTDPCKVDAS